MARFFSPILPALPAALLAAGLFAPAAAAQELAPEAPPEAPHEQAEEAAKPEEPVTLDDVLADLQVVEDPVEVAALVERATELLSDSGSPTANLLAEHAFVLVHGGMPGSGAPGGGAERTAAQEADMRLAIEKLDAALEVRPDYAEGYVRRAAVHYALGEIDAAVIDLESAVTAEPRHFGAYLLLGRIFEETGTLAGALEAYRRAKALNPHVPEIDRTIRRLRDKVEGRGI